MGILHPGTRQDMLDYELGNHFSIETAIVAGELYRYGAV
ncbi:TerD family protein [Paenibacillus silvestris]